jgi:hypothetical protein
MPSKFGVVLGLAVLAAAPLAAFVPIRVNAGGPAFTDGSGNVWAADYGYNGGNVFTTTQAVSNTSKSTLYQSERNSPGTLQYQFNSIPSGTYTVNLRFAEIVYTAAGQRVFNVALNGQTLQSNYDIFAAAGVGFRATDLSFPLTVNAGQITIQFVSVVQNAKIDAIEILQNSAFPLTVSVSPASVGLSQAQSQQFTATVSGNVNTAVTWSMVPQVGTLVNGLYTAPASIASQQTVTVKATSAVDGITAGTATVILNPTVVVAINPTTASLSQGQSKQFTASVTGNTNTGVTWSISPQTGTIVNGLYTAPVSITTQQSVTVKATSVVDGTTASTASVTLLPPLLVSVSPASVSLPQGQAQQFTATVTGNANTAVTWSMSPQVGTLVSGLYTAPASITSQQTVTVKAISAVDGITFGSAIVTLTPPLQVTVAPATTSLFPAQSKQFTATVTGTANTGVTWSMSPVAGTLVNGLYTAPPTITTQQTLTITATSVVDGSKSSSAIVTLTPPPQVSLVPASVSLSQGQTQQFAASVTGTANTAVTWSLTPQVGTLVNGLYTAPSTLSSQQTVTVKATSVADGVTSAAAIVTLTPVVQVSISPTGVNLLQSQTQQFTATVTGSSNTGVTWSVTPLVGTLVNGLYTAPASITAQQTVTVKATSVVDGTTAGTAAVTLTPASGPFVPIRVNAGGPAYTDGSGHVWSADYGYNGGNVFTTSQAVGNTSKSTLYQSERNSIGTLQYQFNSIPAGTYTVNLRFAELLYTAAGQRVFNVAINGQTVQTNYDIFRAAGSAFFAADLSFPITVSAGQITIQFMSVVQNAKVDAIEILQNSVAPLTVAVSPSSASLSQNQSKQFTAIVTGNVNTTVNWSLNPQVGTVVNGLYTAPSVIAAAQTVTVKATSAVDGTTAGTATVTIAPLQVTVSPAAVSLSAAQMKQFTAAVTGNANTGVTWSMTPQVGTLVNGLYSAPAVITVQQMVTVTATSVVDGTTAGTATVTLSNLQVSVSPSAYSMPQGQSKQFTATVTGSGNTAVTWSLTPAVGTIVNGLYTAPSSVSVQQMVTVKATSTVDNATFGTATVTLMALGLPTVTRVPYLQTGTPTGVDIRWRTDVASDSRVRYGTTQGALTYFTDTPTAVTEHDVKLTGLLPNTKYYYSIGSSATDLEGNDANHYFYTPPLTGTVQPMRFWVLGDSGTANIVSQTVRDAYYAFNGTHRTDAWLMLGDNAYTNGTDAEYQAAVFDTFPATLKTTVLWPTIGNHDTAESQTPPPSLPYFNIFTLPAKGEAGGIASGTNRYYSFDYGNVHFICLDSMSSVRTPGSPMLTWLQQDLAANHQRWTVAFFHHPAYGSGVYGSDQDPISIEMRTYVVPILEAGSVDLVMAGHIHQYERTFLIDGHYGLSKSFTSAMEIQGGDGYAIPYFKPGLNPHEGTVYILAGSAGRDEDKSSWGFTIPADEIRLQEYGSVVLDVSGDELDVTFLRDTGAIMDKLRLRKGTR